MASLKRGGLDISKLRNLKLVHHFVNPTIKRELDKLPVESMSTIMIMADETGEGRAVSSDSRNLATLLLLRSIEAKRHRKLKAQQNAQEARRLQLQQEKTDPIPLNSEDLDVPDTSTSTVRRYLNSISSG